MNVRYWNDRPSTFWVAACFVTALVLNHYASALLNSSYAESRFPVPYYVAQLSFDPVQLKAWYRTLAELGTLQRFVLTQHVDFFFIATVLPLHFFGLLLIARLVPAAGRWRNAMVWCAVLSALAPLADAAENGVSYVMLADPDGFAPAWAYVYSSFAAVKFAMFVFAYGAAVLGLAAALVIAGRRVFRQAALD